MDAFLLQHAQRYDFSTGEEGAAFAEAFRFLVEERFLAPANWEPQIAARDYQLRILQCMRVLMRDPAHRSTFSDAGGVNVLVQLLAELSSEHFASPHGDFVSEMLVESLSMLKRFASLEALCPATNTPAEELRLQRSLVVLLSTREALVLQCVLVAIFQFVQREEHLHAIGQLGPAEILLRILTDYEPSFKALAAELLELLLAERTFFQDVLLHEGAPAILSVLHSDDSSVQVSALSGSARPLHTLD